MSRSENIEQNIEDIQDRIKNRIAYLEYRMQPQRLMDNVWRNGQLFNSPAFHKAYDFSRRHPVVTTLAGLGILAALGQSWRNQGRRPYEDPRYQAMYKGYNPATYEEDTSERLAHNIDRVREDVAERTQDMKERAYKTGETLSERGHTMLNSAKDTARKTGETLKNAGQSVKEGYVKSRDTVAAAPGYVKDKTYEANDWVRDNPVPAGLMALAAGAALSSILYARMSGPQNDESGNTLTSSHKRSDFAAPSVHTHDSEEKANTAMSSTPSSLDDPLLHRNKSKIDKKFDNSRAIHSVSSGHGHTHIVPHESV
jgi:gas vesicle protein